MFTIRKMKQESIIKVFLLPLAVLLISAFVAIFSGKAGFFATIAFSFLVAAAYHLILYVRTRHKPTLVQVAYLFDVAIVSIIVSYFQRGDERFVLVFFTIVMIFFLVWMISLAVNKKINFRCREILELAAQPVDGAENGFTGRPFPVGKTEFTSHQILEFSEFVRRNILAVPLIGNDRVVFVHIMPGDEVTFILGIRPDYQDKTWVSIEFDGNLTVHIARSDFYNFVDPLSFEQLNESLGNLWMEFMDMYNRGDSSRIIDRLDKVSVPFLY